RLEEALAAYHHCRQQALIAPAGPDRDALLKECAEVLKTRAAPACAALRTFNARQIELSGAAHLRTVDWMLWGLAGVSLLGAAAGGFLGYGVARALRRSIYQLSVCIRDAAGRLGQALPVVTLARDGDLDRLHEQMRHLVRDIERVVHSLQEREREV